VEKRLLEDAESFAKETASLDEDGFIQRTLRVLGISSEQDTATSQDAPGAGRIQRPAHTGETESERRKKNN
jgi:hypothetical protein